MALKASHTPVSSEEKWTWHKRGLYGFRPHCNVRSCLPGTITCCPTQYLYISNCPTLDAQKIAWMGFFIKGALCRSRPLQLVFWLTPPVQSLGSLRQINFSDCWTHTQVCTVSQETPGLLWGLHFKYFAVPADVTVHNAHKARWFWRPLYMQCSSGAWQVENVVNFWKPQWTIPHLCWWLYSHFSRGPWMLSLFFSPHLQPAAQTSQLNFYVPGEWERVLL